MAGFAAKHPGKLGEYVLQYFDSRVLTAPRRGFVRYPSGQDYLALMYLPSSLASIMPPNQRGHDLTNNATHLLIPRCSSSPVRIAVYNPGLFLTLLRTCGRASSITWESAKKSFRSTSVLSAARKLWDS